MESQSETSQTVFALKLPVLKTREYDIWSMRMEQYLTFTDHALWEVIVNGDSVSLVASASAGAEGPIPPKTAKQKLARKNELKAKSTLMLAIPNEHLLKFHACKDAKSLWEAIKNSLPLAWNNIALIMRNKSDLDTLSMDDLYNNLKVYELEIKVNTAHNVSAASSKDQASIASYADDVMTKVECYNCHRRGHFARECRAPRNQGNKNRDAPRRNAPVDTSTTNALVVQDGIGGYDWSFQAEEGLTNFALMAYTSQGSSSSDSEVHTCSKDYLKSYEALQNQYDQQREALNKSNLEIIGYQMGLESLEARIVVHEKNEVLEEALKEKDDLKLKLEKFKESSKNLTKLINSQISAKDKTSLGYDSQVKESELNNVHKNESEVIHSVFNSRESDVDDNLVNDRFKTGEGFHAVPPPYTGKYMPPRPDLSFAGLYV
ncbi:ribonuclease H-like domain-containing protein [Tanacetum coccineum]